MHPHHIYGRGMGGCNRLDIPENVVAACEECHDLTHRGKITKDDWLAVVAARLGKLQGEIKEKILKLRRTVPRWLRGLKRDQ